MNLLFFDGKSSGQPPAKSRFYVRRKAMKYKDFNEFEKTNFFKRGEFNSAYAQYFTGNSYLNPLTDPKETAVFLANVTFEPGCRNNWATPYLRQIA